MSLWQRFVSVPLRYKLLGSLIITALVAMKKATRDWGDALGGLELQIGLALVPALTDLARTATKFG